MNKVAIIILAAGNSSRLGTPKQLLVFNNKPLVVHVADEACKAGLSPVVIVTGSNADMVSPLVNKEEIVVVYNEHWREGMASGIVAGVNAVLAVDSNIKKLIISVCDQPYLSAEIFQQLINHQTETGKDIVCSAYANTMGTPVLFTQKYFKNLLELKGEEGAKKIVRSNEIDIATIHFPQGVIDIDTMEDYRKLSS